MRSDRALDHRSRLRRHLEREHWLSAGEAPALDLLRLETACWSAARFELLFERLAHGSKVTAYIGPDEKIKLAFVEKAASVA